MFAYTMYLYGCDDVNIAGGYPSAFEADCLFLTSMLRKLPNYKCQYRGEAITITPLGS